VRIQISFLCKVHGALWASKIPVLPRFDSEIPRVVFRIGLGHVASVVHQTHVEFVPPQCLARRERAVTRMASPGSRLWFRMIVSFVFFE